MPVITFLPSNKKINISTETTLFDAALTANLPVASSCSAQGVCGKCNMTVLEGDENLSEKSQNEILLLKKQGKPVTDRISCLTKANGDCKVKTSYW